MRDYISTLCIKQMIYISEKDQERIKQKINGLNGLLKKEWISVVFFEFVGSIILAYGWCVSRFNHPISDHKININFEFLISCFYYFALSVAAPFSSGHLNPMLTLAFSYLRPCLLKKYYIIAQLVGALVGSGIATLFFQVNPVFYWETVSFGSLALDCLGQAFGAFVFVLFVLVITETNYMAGQYFRYLLMAIMLLAGRIFTLRKGCLNPAIGVTMQFFAAIQKGNGLLLLYSLSLIIGPIVGGYVSVYFFRHFYAPLKQGLALQKIHISHLDQSEQA